VDSEDLTSEQARRVGAVVGRYLNYLGRLRERMQRRGFPPTDPLVLSVTKAWNEAHELSVRLHYLSCSSGVGRPGRPKINSK
jgi:hypothetical protein